MAILLVVKAEFLVRKELEKEYRETPHPDPHYYCAPTNSDTEQTPIKLTLK